MIRSTIHSKQKRRGIYMNKVILMGRLTRDPEVRYSAGENALAIARYTLAVDRRFRRDGEATAVYPLDVQPSLQRSIFVRDLRSLFQDAFRQAATLIVMARRSTQQR